LTGGNERKEKGYQLKILQDNLLVRFCKGRRSNYMVVFVCEPLKKNNLQVPFTDIYKRPSQRLIGLRVMQMSTKDYIFFACRSAMPPGTAETGS
jgi:hypothetical protein